ncbi:MAG TPA: DegT/DnrJ/EryC1/StrS family aminotransferase [Symbiobacteriaceae bacterium]|jgi:dTDP-4-amino-4,6-dideoxygalactose transaminase|nr:DegT/DnrJ/EryC1/StrS family aminotransferase [Symbiobacteriaceae bacterium]
MTRPAVPILDLSPEIGALWAPLMEAIADVLRSGQFIMGPQVALFERETAAFLGVKHAVAVNSGTDALVIALRAAGIGPGDEVITSPFTFFATAEAISQVGAQPVFVDIDRVTYNLNPWQLEAAITERTAAILPVHLFGHAAEMDAVLRVARRHGLQVVEDVAQAFGGRYRGQRLGSLGDAAAFSFFPSKNLGACGDGGLIATNDDAVADACRMLRSHGSRRKYYNETIGYNSRLDELQAAILRVKLPHLPEWNDRRRLVAARYRDLLGDLPIHLPVEAPEVEHVYHQYTVRIPDGRRDAVHDALQAAGVGSMVYYPVPLHRLPVYAEMGCHLPEAERAAAEVLSLPMGPCLAPEEQDRVAGALRMALA